MSQERSRYICQKVIDRVQNKKINQCDVITQSGQVFSTSVQKGMLDKYQVSSSTITGLRIIHEKRVGIAYSESQDDDALDRMVDQAIDNARFSDVDEWQSIDARNDSENLVVDDPALNLSEDVTHKEIVDLCIQLENDVLGADQRIASVPYNAMGDRVVEYAIGNHLGTFAYHKERFVSCYVAALTKDGERQAMFGASELARSFEKLDTKKCVQAALKYALPLLEATPIKTGRYDVVFEIDQLHQLFAAFLSIFSAKQVLEGRSGLKGRMDTAMASDLLTIVDDPLNQDGFGYSRFDDEGNSREAVTLIENGRLNSFLHNSATAKHMGTKNTAHASRGPRSSLGVSSSQIRVQEGLQTMEDLESGRYLQIAGLKGIHSGTDPISGRFSLAAEGCLIENGVVSQYVKGITISGNFFDLLQQVVAVGSNSELSSSRTFIAPRIRFENMSIAGI